MALPPRVVLRRNWLRMAIWVVALAVLIVAVVLETNRDLGAGIIALRPGPVSASALTRTVVGLPLRLQRTSLISWTIGCAFAGIFFVGIATVVAFLAAFIPRAATAIAWSLYGVIVLLAGLGDVLGLPHDVVAATPFWAVPQPGRADSSWLPVWLMGAAAVVVIAAALWRYRTRDEVTA